LFTVVQATRLVGAPKILAPELRRFSRRVRRTERGRQGSGTGPRCFRILWLHRHPAPQYSV